MEGFEDFGIFMCLGFCMIFDVLGLVCEIWIVDGILVWMLFGLGMDCSLFYRVIKSMG